jgi:hypothetical protein
MTSPGAFLCLFERPSLLGPDVLFLIGRRHRDELHLR